MTCTEVCFFNTLESSQCHINFQHGIHKKECETKKTILEGSGSLVPEYSASIQRIIGEIDSETSDSESDDDDDYNLVFKPAESFQSIKTRTTSLLFRMSHELNFYKTVITEIVKTTGLTETQEEEYCRLENEINKNLKAIDQLQIGLDRCCNQELTKKYSKSIYKLSCNSRSTITKLRNHLESKADISFKQKIQQALNSTDVKICNYLGLKLNTLEDISEELNGKKESIYSIEEWVLVIMEARHEDLQEKGKFEVSVWVLDKIGFTTLGAQKLMDSIPTDLKGHLSTIDWVKIYIQNQFKFHILLAEEFPERFPFKKEKTKKWFSLKKGEYAWKPSQCNSKDVSVINLEGREDDSFKWRKNLNPFPKSLYDGEYTVLFHGTDHLSAKDILSYGIRLRKGKNRDFSCRKGFYLLNNVEDAINWAFALPRSKPAVLIYRTKTEWLRDRQFLNLTCRKSEEEWKETVRFYLTGAEDKRRRREFYKYQFIEGPMVGIQRSQNGDLNPISRPGSYQLCITCEDFAEEFSSTIHSVMFFDR